MRPETVGEAFRRATYRLRNWPRWITGIPPHMVATLNAKAREAWHQLVEDGPPRWYHQQPLDWRWTMKPWLRIAALERVVGAPR